MNECCPFSIKFVKRSRSSEYIHYPDKWKGSDSFIVLTPTTVNEYSTNTILASAIGHENSPRKGAHSNVND
mgnify:CR=1 FL=1